MPQACSHRRESFAGVWGVPNQRFRISEKDILKHCWPGCNSRSLFISESVSLSILVCSRFSLLRVHIFKFMEAYTLTVILLMKVFHHKENL